MTNSDYLLKAAIKKVTEKLNEILVEKFEEATNIAQDAPEILKKEFDSLKESIIEEASRLEKAENIQETEFTNTYQDSKIKKALIAIEDINKQIDLFNKTINNQITYLKDDFYIDSRITGRNQIQDNDIFFADELVIQTAHKPGASRINQVETISKFQKCYEEILEVDNLIKPSICGVQYVASYGSKVGDPSIHAIKTNKYK